MEGAGSGGAAVLGDDGRRVWRVPGASPEAGAELGMGAGTAPALTGDGKSLTGRDGVF